VTKTKLRTPKNRELRASDTGPTATQAEVDNLALRRRCHVVAGIIAVVMVGIVCVLSTNSLLWPSDHFSDMNVLLAGQNFAKHGFWKLHFLAVHYPTPTPDSPGYYKHYPPLPDLINGVWQTLGITDLTLMRMVTGSLFIVGLLCMYRAFSLELGPLAAVCGLGFLATTGYFLCYAVSIHQHAYNTLVIGLFFLLVIRAARAEGFRRKTLFACWFVLFFGSLSSYEFILYCQIFAWVYFIANGQIRRQWRSLLILATAPMAGVGLHFLQNCWAVGFSAAMADGLGYGQYLEKGRWYWIKQIPSAYAARTELRFYWPWPALLVFGLLWLMWSGRLRRSPESYRRAGALFLALIIAPLGWYLFMARHAVVHEHTVNQLLPLAFAAMGCVIALIGRWLFAPGQPISARFLAAIALVVLTGGQAQTISQRLEEWKFGFGHILEAIGPDALPPKAAVVSNMGLEPHVAYFLNRPFWRVPRYDHVFPDSIPSFRKHLPDDWTLNDYLFVGNPQMEPFRFLASNYPGRRLSVPGMRIMIVLFDISQLHLPPDQRTPLPQTQRENQLRGLFPEWEIPGFRKRLQNLSARFQR